MIPLRGVVSQAGPAPTRPDPVEAGSRGRAVVGVSRPAFYLPAPLLRKEGTPFGTTHVLPSTHTNSGRTLFLFLSEGGNEVEAVHADESMIRQPATGDHL